MDHNDHLALIRKGVSDRPGTWAELGSGRGAFTLALADLLGERGSIVSVDRDVSALSEQRREIERRFPYARVEYRVADFTQPLDLPPLDGVLMANSLHFVRDKTSLLQQLLSHLPRGGRFVLVEYDADHGNQWVPFPVSLERWRVVAADVGLRDTRELGRAPSRFLGAIYGAASEFHARDPIRSVPIPT